MDFNQNRLRFKHFDFLILNFQIYRKGGFEKFWVGGGGFLGKGGFPSSN